MVGAIYILWLLPLYMTWLCIRPTLSLRFFFYLLTMTLKNIIKLNYVDTSITIFSWPLKDTSESPWENGIREVYFGVKILKSMHSLLVTDIFHENFEYSIYIYGLYT